MKCAVKAAMSVAKAMAIPPPRGVGMVWELRVLGMSKSRRPNQ